MNEDYNRVFFDGNELSYIVNGVQVINGEFPTEYELKGDYLINAGDLAIIESVINSKKGSIQRFSFHGGTIIVNDVDNIVKSIKECLDDTEKDRVNCLKIYEKLKSRCEKFNDLPWYKRIFKKIEMYEK